ncbi:MAG TPA: metallophosphoesterase [Actinomycetota bacterium]|nr:metallophosphoesterase [Actinomycetota bacterium]
MIRIAAAGDLHYGVDSAGRMRPALADLDDHADILCLAGDLTTRGRPEEAEVLARELADAPVPVVAVLGNHDYHTDQQQEVTEILERAGARVLEGTSLVHEVNGVRVGIAGVKGFGGGFAGASGSEFGEPEMKLFMRVTIDAANRLDAALTEMDADLKIALMHFSPIPETLEGEPLEIYPFLGSYLLAEPLDKHRVDLALHGHAHRGDEHGETPGGVPVRNVAQHVLEAPYKVYSLDPENAERRDRSDATIGS